MLLGSTILRMARVNRRRAKEVRRPGTLGADGRVAHRAERRTTPGADRRRRHRPIGAEIHVAAVAVRILDDGDANAVLPDPPSDQLALTEHVQQLHLRHLKRDFHHTTPLVEISALPSADLPMKLR